MCQNLKYLINKRYVQTSKITAKLSIFIILSKFYVWLALQIAVSMCTVTKILGKKNQHAIWQVKLVHCLDNSS
jgi:hypothetical protein